MDEIRDDGVSRRDFLKTGSAAVVAGAAAMRTGQPVAAQSGAGLLAAGVRPRRPVLAGLVGFGVGFKTLIGPAGGLRVEYQFRRVLDDPVEDVSEHQLLLGVSLFFLNG